VAWWSDGKLERILFGAGTKLHSVDARSGKPVLDFGDNGTVDLTQGLDREPPGAVNGISTPGIVYKDLIIVGGSVGEGPRPAAPGHVRAYNIRTGRRAWIFHTIPHPGEFGHETWEGDAWKTAGGANNWGGMSLDEKRGIVYVSTGSPAFDFYGGQRVGQNLFGNSVVALDAGYTHLAASGARGRTRCGCTANQDGAPVGARPPERRTSLWRGGTARSGLRYSRRAGIAGTGFSG
jgi:quinoprotein glucose dehydrogenase